MKNYYEIDERLARLSKQSYSFSDYIEGSATSEYQEQVNDAYKLVDAVHEENKGKALYYADIYAKKLANCINGRFIINISYPNVIITGTGDYPIRKHEKQMQRLDNLFIEYESIEGYLDKIRDLKHNKVRAEKQRVAEDTDLANSFFEVVNFVYCNMNKDDLVNISHIHNLWLNVVERIGTNPEIIFENATQDLSEKWRSIYEAYKSVDFEKLRKEVICGNVYYYNIENIAELTDDMINHLMSVPQNDEAQFLEFCDGELILS